jgi:hypothetical protein
VIPKKRQAATVVALTIGWDAAEVRECQYQPSRLSSPSVFAIGGRYFAVHATKPLHDLGGEWREHDDQFFTRGTQRKVWVSEVIYSEGDDQ